MDYWALIFICGAFMIIAFLSASPSEIMHGFGEINTSRSVLVSDYIAMAGLGATLFNAALSCGLFLLLLILTKTKPNGKIITALFLTLGFSMFGKNIVNTLPLCLGVGLYARIHRDSFGVFVVNAMFSATVSPIVSEIAFSGGDRSVPRFIIAYGAGIVIGFVFPALVTSVKKIHNDYCHYNSGIAGGFIATFAAGIFKSMGYEIVPEFYWETSSKTSMYLGIWAYSFAVISIIFGLVAGGENIKSAFRKFKAIFTEKEKHNNDYHFHYGISCYINIGIMCIIATTTMLILKFPINGPVLGGIITIAGFAVAGKQMRNTVPIILGSIAAVYLNRFEVTEASNALSILFSTGLAPIACKFGFFWGIIAGFMHVSVAIFIGDINGGLNLYNNGFAGGFVAITLVPIILLFNKVVLGKEEIGHFTYKRRKGD